MPRKKEEPQGKPECGNIHLKPRVKGANSVQTESGAWVSVTHYYCDSCGADWTRP